MLRSTALRHLHIPRRVHPPPLYARTRSSMPDSHTRSVSAPASRDAPTPPLPPGKVLCAAGGVNPLVERIEYAVRGELVARAEALARELKAHPGSRPFDRVTYCNIGNPHSVAQPPITFVRQVLAAAVCPPSPATRATLPDDVVRRADSFLAAGHGVGAYSESPGLAELRARVARAIERRDGGAACDPDSIFLTNGASEGVRCILQMLIRESTDGVLIPIPQYPLYSATMAAMNGSQVGYYLDEEHGWSLGMDEMERALGAAREKGVTVRGLVVINPGNPTGQVLTRDNLVEIVQFCERERLVLLADEVYQKNVYVPSKPFVSFKSVVSELNSNVELVSFHSVSKGMLGECGLRGGYMEVVNLEEHARDMIYKVLSVSLCSNVVGQIAIDLMMTPPVPGDTSYELYNTEVTQIYNSLKRKAASLSDALNSFEGVTCNPSEGAMYLFPRITIPQGAAEAAVERGVASPDTLYCIELLEATGICVVPGSGFGQRKGTYHFRTTFLPPEDQIEEVVEKMRLFHEGFMTKYS